MNLGMLLKTQGSGALNIKYEKGKQTAMIGDMVITEQQALAIVRNLGWTENYLHPFEIIEKTNKFARSFKRNIKNEALLEHSTVEFQNKRSSTYGKSFDRIHIECEGSFHDGLSRFSISILYNMEGNTTPYVVYDSTSSIPIAKCRNLKAVAEFIETL